jgi:cobalt-zinc-cadmium efflux system membrane fusion protein
MRRFAVHLTSGHLAGIGLAFVGSIAVTFWLARRPPAATATPPAAPDKVETAGFVALTPEATKAAELEVLSAVPEDVSVSLVLPGEVALNEETLVHVSPRVPGVATRVDKRLGDGVKKGDVLAVLLSRDWASSQNDLLTAQERLGLAESNFAREEKLWKDHLTTEKEYLAAKQGLSVAKLDRDVAARRIQALGGATAGVAGGYAITAPLDGTIIARDVVIGEVIKEDTVVFTVADLSTLWVNVAVYARDLPRVQIGQEATVSADGVETPIVGKIAFLGPLASDRTRTAVARVVLTNPGASWRPGLFATARVNIATVHANVTVAEDAVQLLGGTPTVFVERKGGFEARTVRVGRKGRTGKAPGRGVMEVIEGVAPGERYVGKNSFLLKSQLQKGASTGE